MDKKIPIIAIIICAALAVTLIVVLLPKGADTPPSIGEPIYSGAYATESTQIDVDVTDDKGVSNVTVTYSNDSQATWYDVVMSNSGGATWSGNIPPQDIETTIHFKITARDTANQLATNDNDTNYFKVNTGSRKAFIVCSANDFYGTEFEDDFNNGHDSTFESDSGRWEFSGINVTGLINTGSPGKFTLGFLQAANLGGNPAEGRFTYAWSNYYNLTEYAYYNMSGWVAFASAMLIPDGGARFGLQWLDSDSQEVRTDWSETINYTDAGEWVYLEVVGVCNNQTGNEIAQLKLVCSVNGTWGDTEELMFDDLKIERNLIANVTNPFDPGNPPPARNKNCDGFPGQALQVYKVLKSHGYSDENIYLMVYYKDDTDGVIDIVAGDGIANDLVGVTIDVENDSVTANRVKQELNVSVVNSFASTIQPNDQLIIYMADHGSNKHLPDNNATFHFEADQSFITEAEFYALVSQIDCWRMMINIDCCFSGNFLNQNSSIGQSWFNLTNCIFVSASANVFSWYWVDNGNGDMFAGSWFFHVFWDQLDQNKTIGQAFNFAFNFIPFGRMQPLAVIQFPLIQDNLGIKDTWSFNSFSKL